MDNQPVPTTQPPTPTVTIPSQEQTKPYKRNWKKWIIIYLIIGAILYSSIYYFVLSKKDSTPPYQTPTQSISPSLTPDPTASWKTYTNNKYKYSIKYPPNWYIDSTYAENDLARMPNGASLMGGGLVMSNYKFDEYTADNYKNGKYISLLIYKTDPTTSLASLKDEVANSQTVLKEENISINAINGILLLMQNQVNKSSPPESYVLLNANDKVFAFSQKGSIEPKIFAQILSTFKFTD